MSAAGSASVSSSAFFPVSPVVSLSEPSPASSAAPLSGARDSSAEPPVWVPAPSPSELPLASPLVFSSPLLSSGRTTSSVWLAPLSSTSSAKADTGIRPMTSIATRNNDNTFFNTGCFIPTPPIFLYSLALYTGSFKHRVLDLLFYITVSVQFAASKPGSS